LHIILKEVDYDIDFGSANNPFIMSADQNTLCALTLSANCDVINQSSFFDYIIPMMQRWGQEGAKLEE
jgi:hypothetical protein